jgi:hypothetical protein
VAHIKESSKSNSKRVVKVTLRVVKRELLCGLVVVMHSAKGQVPGSSSHLFLMTMLGEIPPRSYYFLEFIYSLYFYLPHVKDLVKVKPYIIKI